MRRSRIVLVMTIAIYFSLMFFAHIPDSLILFPSTEPLDARGASQKFIPFQKGQLGLWTSRSRIVQRSARPEIYVLRFYGNADRADRWVAAEAEMWNGRSVEVWGMNYPGYGGSTGPARLGQIGPAALTAFDTLKREAGDRPIVVFGASLGTTAALDVAAHRPVNGLLLQNPPPLRQMILRQFGWWNLWLLAGPAALQIPRDLDNVANAKQTRVPAIFLLADADEIVAPRFQKLVVDAYAGPKRILTLRGANHNSPIEGAAVADFYGAVDWLLPRNSEAIKADAR
jgi:pimeloyl-ACP methyl ester carboxylesterase